MSIETISSSQLPFSIAAGTESTKIGQVNSTNWFMVFNWKPTSAYGFDLKSVKLVRLGKSDENLIVLIDIKNLCENFLVCFNNEQAHANILNNNFVATFDNTEELKGTITIVNVKVCRSTNENNANPLNAAVSKPIDPLPKLSEDLHSLLTEPSVFADVTLKCAGSNFSAHRCILSTRSPVFAAMFRNEDMQENQKGIIDIVDIKEDVVQAMLKYIYGGKIDDLSHFMTGDLLFAADKYEIEGLKQICADILKNTLEMESVLQVLILGYLHDELLKKYAIKFICEQNLFRKLKETEEWDLVQKNHPSLAMELLTTVVNYLDDLKSTSTDDIPCWDHLIKEPTTTVAPEGLEFLFMLADASAQEQKQMLGERLFSIIHRWYPDMAGKVTGMLLEIDNSELLHMLEHHESLKAKVKEAMAVLQAHQAKESPPEGQKKWKTHWKAYRKNDKKNCKK